MASSISKEELVENAKNALLGNEIVKFDLRTLPFVKSKLKNDKIFVEWLIKFLDQYKTKNSQCLSANEKTNEFLKEKLYPMTWLNYSPRDNNQLQEDEILVDFSRLNDE